MKGLFLYGIKCQPWIWKDVKKDLEDYDIDYVVYPEEITKKCESVDELSKWVYETYFSHNQEYDFILGHSMGGLIALQLSARSSLPFKKTILVESFLTTIEPVYQNLMTDSHIGEPKGINSNNTINTKAKLVWQPYAIHKRYKKQRLSNKLVSLCFL